MGSSCIVFKDLDDDTIGWKQSKCYCTYKLYAKYIMPYISMNLYHSMATVHALIPRGCVFEVQICSSGNDRIALGHGIDESR